jgi:hypothetical protein
MNLLLLVSGKDERDLSDTSDGPALRWSFVPLVPFVPRFTTSTVLPAHDGSVEEGLAG